MGNIEHGFNACRAAHEGFNSKANLPPLGSDAVRLRLKCDSLQIYENTLLVIGFKAVAKECN